VDRTCYIYVVRSEHSKVLHSMIRLLLVCISIAVVKFTVLMYRDIILFEKCWYQLLSAALLTKCWCAENCVFVVCSVHMWVKGEHSQHILYIWRL